MKRTVVAAFNTCELGYHSDGAWWSQSFTTLISRYSEFKIQTSFHHTPQTAFFLAHLSVDLLNDNRTLRQPWLWPGCLINRQDEAIVQEVGFAKASADADGCAFVDLLRNWQFVREFVYLLIVSCVFCHDQGNIWSISISVTRYSWSQEQDGNTEST